MRAVVWCAAAAALCGCGGSAPPGPALSIARDDGGTGAVAPSEDAGSPTADAADSGAAEFDADAAQTPAANTCAVAFAVASAAEDYDLYAIDPAGLPDVYRALSRIGRMTGCAVPGANLFSVAVDASATMWLNYDNGEIRRSPTTGVLGCAPTPFAAGQWGFGNSLHLAAAPSSRGIGESLYVFDPQSSRVAEVDTQTMTLRPLPTAPTPSTMIFSFAGRVWYDGWTNMPGYGSSLQGMGGGGPVPLPNFLVPSKVPMFGLAGTFYFVLYGPAGSAPPSDQIVRIDETPADGGWTTNPPRYNVQLPVRIHAAAVSSCAR